MNLIENEDLAWERFQKAMTDEDVAACYDMSLKNFEHFGVHDFFKVCDFTFALSCHFTLFSSNELFYLFIFTLGNVKVHHSIQAGHQDGQDEDTT